jgi:hypothetical protein
MRLCLHFCRDCPAKKYAPENEMPAGWEQVGADELCADCAAAREARIKTLLGDGCEVFFD